MFRGQSWRTGTWSVGACWSVPGGGDLDQRDRSGGAEDGHVLNMF